MSKPIKFLKKLVETPSPTGQEMQVADLVRERLSNVADEIQTDTMGSVHAILKGSVELAEEQARMNANDPYSLSNPSSYTGDFDYTADYAFAEIELGEKYAYSRSSAPTLMLSAHMDEVGLMVTYISDDGFLSVSAVGGVDAAILPGMRVDVHAKDGVYRGVVGRKPIHLIDSDERKAVTELDKLVIDLGMGGDKVKSLISVGDQITYGVGFEKFGKNMAVSKSFDDKCGVYVACRVMEKLADSVRPEATYIAAITVQEEIGTRGAITSAHSINPDVAIAFDVTHATDYPNIDKSKYGSIVCGEGPVIARGPNINPLVFDRLIAAAEAEGVSYQLEAEPSVTGTDARSIQVAQGGIPTGLISVPLRYMHTPTEVVNLKDIEGAIKIISRFVRDLDSNASFIPGITPKIEHVNAGQIKKKPKTDKERIAILKDKINALNERISIIERDSSNKGSDPISANNDGIAEDPKGACDNEAFSNTPASQNDLPAEFKKTSFSSIEGIGSLSSIPHLNSESSLRSANDPGSGFSETGLPMLGDLPPIGFPQFENIDDPNDTSAS